jgi:hypothetical protein
MQVIADLHGGDLEDVSAKAEFQEIKDRVNFDVSYRYSYCSHGVLRSPFVAVIRRGAFLQGHVGEVQTQSPARYVLPSFRPAGKR